MSILTRIKCSFRVVPASYLEGPGLDNDCLGLTLREWRGQGDQNYSTTTHPFPMEELAAAEFWKRVFESSDGQVSLGSPVFWKAFQDALAFQLEEL